MNIALQEFKVICLVVSSVSFLDANLMPIEHQFITTINEKKIEHK